jgi:hypothetical protein
VCHVKGNLLKVDQRRKIVLMHYEAKIKLNEAMHINYLLQYDFSYRISSKYFLPVYMLKNEINFVSCISKDQFHRDVGKQDAMLCSKMAF